MQFKTVTFSAVVFVLLILSSFNPTVSAQEESSYYATVKPILADLPQYMSIGRTVNVPFEAQWTYGPNQDRFIENATATIAVTNQKGELVGTIIANTTTGAFVVNYTQNKPNILSFNATELVTQDGQEWNSDPCRFRKLCLRVNFQSCASFLGHVPRVNGTLQHRQAPKH